MKRYTPAAFVLEDGRIFYGEAFGAQGQTLGEAVFTTGMTGYQETLTDPSYHRQIVVATAPQIGNTGWNDEDGESLSSSIDPNAAVANGQSGKVWVSGYVIRDLSGRASNWRSQRPLEEELISQGIVGIQHVDTRAIVRHLRTRGSMKAGVFSGSKLPSESELVSIVQSQPSMEGANLSSDVSTNEGYTIEPLDGDPRFSIAAVDLGIKTNTPRELARRGVRIHVVPATVSMNDILDKGVDGVFLSNGPGDPATANAVVELTREVLDRGLPLFGICFGNQILGRALGLETYKMKFGHRGLNIPVIDYQTGHVSITTQNHGFALEGEAGAQFDTPFGRAIISHTCANDGTVEGVKLLDGSAFSVQYHPEAAAGPHDAVNLFDQFIAALGHKQSAGSTGKVVL